MLQIRHFAVSFGSSHLAISQTRKDRPPLTLDKVLDFGFLGPETKVGEGRGRRPPRTLVSSFDPHYFGMPLNFGQN